MDYSAANTALWNCVVQIGIICVFILAANIMRRKIPGVQKLLLPTSVLAGFLLLLFKVTGILKVDVELMEMLTYHCIAIGFIALSLRVPEEAEKGKSVGLRSGAVIVGSYAIQGVTGLILSLLYAFIFQPEFFKAAGILLPMAYGQGPGQASNIGASYEALGFAGGHSFGVALAAVGYLVACIIGVIYVNWLVKKKGYARRTGKIVGGEATVGTFQSAGEVPVSESLDRLSVQVVLVVVVYLVTFLLTKGLTYLLSTYLPGVAKMVNSLLWGFNFIFGSAIAIGFRSLLAALKKNGAMELQYQNNYLLSRISGLAFDIMIVAGIASIEPEDLNGLWIPFILMAVAGAIVTLFHLKFVCRKIYGDYYAEALVSMYGMMTGTISSGILLLREIDPNLSTPAANNLVLGSSFGILLGIPLLLLVSLAPKSTVMTVVTLGLLVVYYAVMIAIICIRKKTKK